MSRGKTPVVSRVPTGSITLQSEGDERCLDTLRNADLQSILSIAGNVGKIPEKVQAMLALASIGWSAARIGEIVGMTRQGVWDTLTRYDPKRIFRANPAACLALRAALLMTRSDQIFWGITDADIAAASLREKAYAYDRLAGRADALISQVNAMESPRHVQDIEDMMQEIKCDSSEEAQ